MTWRRCHLITWPLLVGVVACNGGELTRSHAAKELAARFNGSVGSIRVFRTKCVEKYFEKYPIRFIEDAQLARHYRSLEDAGLATQFEKPSTSEQCGTPYPESLRVIGMTLTPKGVAQQWPEHRERGGGWDVALGNREFATRPHTRPCRISVAGNPDCGWSRTRPDLGTTRWHCHLSAGRRGVALHAYGLLTPLHHSQAATRPNGAVELPILFVTPR
jgi:hypothetical protein